MDLKVRALSILESELLTEKEREQKLLTLFGINHDKIEKQIKSLEPDYYVGLDQFAFATSFKDYFTILSDLDRAQTLVDLGAGHCKGSLLANALDTRRVLSLEVESVRVENAIKASKALGLESIDMKVFDLLSEVPPLEEAYYIYLPLGPLIFKVLEVLLKHNHKCCLYVVESHGDVIDFYESLPEWFTLEKVLPSTSERHRNGIFKFHFSPKVIEKTSENSYELMYWLIQNYSSNPEFIVKKESGDESIRANSLIPLKYNNEMMFECITLKRIVDFKNVKLFYR